MKSAIFGRSLTEVDFQAPEWSQIRWTDVAYGLAGAHRFAAQCPKRINVAGHSLFVAKTLATRGYDKLTQLLGLCHDGSEAYTGDISAPLKQLVPEFKQRVELPLMAVIWERLSFDMAVENSGTNFKFDSYAGYAQGFLQAHAPFNDSQRSWRDVALAINAMPAIKEVDMLSREVERALTGFHTDSWRLNESVMLTPQLTDYLMLSSVNAESEWLANFEYLAEAISGRHCS